jgi:hypothetical protein
MNWTDELIHLEKYLSGISGKIGALEKELQSLIHTSEDVVALLYARRSLEVIIIELCEHELKRARGSEPLQGIIDKLEKEKIIPEYMHTSMCNLNRITTYGAHPKEFKPQQVRSALIDLSIIIEWFVKSKNIDIQLPALPEILQINNIPTQLSDEPNTFQTSGNSVAIKPSLSNFAHKNNFDFCLYFTGLYSDEIGIHIKDVLLLLTRKYIEDIPKITSSCYRKIFDTSYNRTDFNQWFVIQKDESFFIFEFNRIDEPAFNIIERKIKEVQKGNQPKQNQDIPKINSAKRKSIEKQDSIKTISNPKQDQPVDIQKQSNQWNKQNLISEVLLDILEKITFGIIKRKTKKEPNTVTSTTTQIQKQIMNQFPILLLLIEVIGKKNNTFEYYFQNESVYFVFSRSATIPINLLQQVNELKQSLPKIYDKDTLLMSVRNPDYKKLVTNGIHTGDTRVELRKTSYLFNELISNAFNYRIRKNLDFLELNPVFVISKQSGFEFVSFNNILPDDLKALNENVEKLNTLDIEQVNESYKKNLTGNKSLGLLSIRKETDKLITLKQEHYNQKFDSAEIVGLYTDHKVNRNNFSLFGPLIIHPTDDNPMIVLDKENGIFEISGMSLPEDYSSFYSNVLQWMADYVKNPNSHTEFVFNMDYFNSSSARKIVEIIIILESLALEGKSVKVVWIYNDEIMQERGQEIMSVVEVPFELRPY